jgi:hypothetical protein
MNMNLDTPLLRAGGGGDSSGRVDRATPAVAAAAEHGLTELELAFVSGPFLAAQRDVRGLARLRDHLGRELAAVFDAIDVNGDNYLEPLEVITLARAVGCTEVEARSASRRVFHEILVGSATRGRMSREQWLVFFHCLLSRSADGSADGSLEGVNLAAMREPLSDLAAECSALTSSSLAHALATIGHASVFHVLSCAALIATCVVASPLASGVDKLYASLVNSTATPSAVSNSGLHNLEDSIFTRDFTERANIVFVVLSSLGAIVGLFVLAQTRAGYCHAKGIAETATEVVSDRIRHPSLEHQMPILRTRSFGLISCLSSSVGLAVLMLSGMQYVAIGNGNTMCLQACGSVCADAFPNNTRGGTADDDFLACQSIANQNCSCGLNIMKGKTPEQQMLEIKGLIPQMMSPLRIHGNMTLTFQGYTSRGISVDATPTAIAGAISEIGIGQRMVNGSAVKISIGEVFGPVVTRPLVDTKRRKGWNIVFQGCFEDLGAAVVDTSGVQLTNADGSITGGGTIVAVVNVLDVGRPGTVFLPIENEFSDYFYAVAVVGLVCALALGLTGMLAGVLGCSENRMCLVLRGWLGLGKVKSSSAVNPKLEKIHQRLRSVFT